MPGHWTGKTGPGASVSFLGTHFITDLIGDVEVPTRRDLPSKQRLRAGASNKGVNCRFLEWRGTKKHQKKCSIFALFSIIYC